MLILLADDERLVRLGLESMLNELFPGQHTYLHAKNGNEVLDILKKQIPDVAFLDVKMPLLNGLDALRLCKEVSDSTVWIILSGYADFEYAQRAVSLSAFDYLLKPADPETLRKLFDRIEINRIRNRKNRAAVFAHDVIRSFNMADQFSAKETDFQPVCVRTYDELMDLLERYTFRIDGSTHYASEKDIIKIQDFIRQNYADDVSISCVSEKFNLSPTYLSRLFHEKTRQKYIDFVTQVRMEAARKLLRDKDTFSVKQVSEAVGYSSVRHFSKTFQKYTGVLPSNYQTDGSSTSLPQP